MACDDDDGKKQRMDKIHAKLLREAEELSYGDGEDTSEETGKPAPKQGQPAVFENPGIADLTRSTSTHYSQERGWGGNDQQAMGGVAQGASFTPISNPWGLPVQGQSTPPSGQEKPRPNYRQQRIDRVSELMRNRYRRIISETNSTLLVDTHTGDVLPEIVEAVSAPLVTQYRRQFGAEASTAEVKRAFIHFVQVMAFWETEVFFGRAGYNAQCRQRYIDSGPGNCFVFEAGTPSYRVVEGQPRIRPTQSRPLPSTAHVGNIQSGVFDTLFSGSVLPKESDLLLIAWMILSWMPDRKQVMLELLGKPSAALEEAQSLIKKVVDPATEALMNELPNHVKQFDQLATQHYLLSFNQVDALSSRQQAHFFNLMRGKQIQWEWKGKKTDARITVQCPVMLNSLESVATETKLANATLSLEVEESPSQYTGAALTSFQEPAIVAGLLMVFGQVNAQWNMVEYDGRYDRYDDLADLCRVGVLIAQIFCQDANVFWEQFQANQQGRRAFELEESPVALAVKKLLDDEPKGVIDIPAKEWKTRLAPYRPKDVSPELWPTHSRGVGAKFKQIQPLLRDVGITLTSKGQRGPLCYWRAEKAVVEQQEAE